MALDMYMIVNPHGRAIKVSTGANLLRVLLGEKIPVPYSCEDGRCGMCRYELVNGSVLEGGSPPWQVPGMGRHFKLACQSTILGHCTVRLPDTCDVAVHAQRKFQAKVLSKEKLAKRIVSLTISKHPAFTFSPGQFVELKLGPGLVRTYSIANSVTDSDLSFHLQLHHYGRASGYVWDSLQVGSDISVSGPLGVSYLRAKDSRPIICASSESGLGPLMTILRGIRDAGMENPVHVYLGFLREEDIYLVKEVEELVAQIRNLKCCKWIVYTAASRTTSQCQTLTSVIAADFRELHEYRAYLFGSAGAIEALARLVANLGISKEHLHADAFTISDN